jgi:hypothetical protein
MYQQMWNRYQTGKITQRGWINFCKWYMWNVIMVQPEVVEIMVRMKHN